MSGGGGSQTSTVTNTSQLPPEMRAYVSGAGAQGLKALNAVTPRITAPGAYQLTRPQDIAGLNADQYSGLSTARNTALQGNPLVGVGMDYATTAARGDFLDSNPFVDDVVANTRNDVMNDTAAQFALGGRAWSPAHAAAATERMTEATLPYLAQNYEAERGRQADALNYLTVLDAARYTDANQLAAVGDVFQQQQQRESDALYNFELANLSRALERDVAIGNLGRGAGSQAGVGASSTRTETQPYSRSSNILGGALSGAATGNALFPGYGGIIGGLGGGILGAFG